METRATRIGLWAWGALVFAFLWIPLAIMAVYLVIMKRLGAFESL
jgi:ABC-type spermidine/putrescine transport system permease subunit II